MYARTPQTVHPAAQAASSRLLRIPVLPSAFMRVRSTALSQYTATSTSTAPPMRHLYDVLTVFAHVSVTRVQNDVRRGMKTTCDTQHSAP